MIASQSLFNDQTHLLRKKQTNQKNWKAKWTLETVPSEQAWILQLPTEKTGCRNSKASWVTALDNYNSTLPCGISLCPVTPELSTFHANKVLISFILNGGPWQEVSRQEIQFQQNSSGRFYHHQALTVSSLTEKKKTLFHSVKWQITEDCCFRESEFREGNRHARGM